MIPIGQGRQGNIYAYHFGHTNSNQSLRQHADQIQNTIESISSIRYPDEIVVHDTHNNTAEESDVTHSDIDTYGGLINWIAIKIVYAPKNGLMKGNEPHNTKNEVDILRRLDHPNIIKILKYEYDEVNLYHKLHLPLYPISLFELFKDNLFPFHYDDVDDFHKLKSEEHNQKEELRIDIPKIISYQLLSAINYLHSANPTISHRDLNPSNILFDQYGNLKLIDFGIAYTSNSSKNNNNDHEDEDVLNEEEIDSIESDDQMCCDVGTGSYRAPELLFSPATYNPTKIDLWSTGCIIAQFFTCFGKNTASTPSSTSSSSISSSSCNSSPLISYINDQTDSYDPLDDDYDQEQNERERIPLFNSTYGSIGLSSSIFKILGKPTNENWPDFNLLPDSNKITFPLIPTFPTKPLIDRLPDLSKFSKQYQHDVLQVIQSLLRLDPKDRIDAKEVLQMNWFKDISEMNRSNKNGLERWIDQSQLKYDYLARRMKEDDGEMARAW
ncbi:uncharacterized protein L201_006912 [Kwoniella dendrophila CBS 6074]|uniref:Protein kinase domain-containing protein n=1 Tax=Kwoniella dendrophila CBS 6074 TaxID=1295534 RepID=A0AAX4K4B6_9TREE